MHYIFTLFAFAFMSSVLAVRVRECRQIMSYGAATVEIGAGEIAGKENVRLVI